MTAPAHTAPCRSRTGTDTSVRLVGWLCTHPALSSAQTADRFLASSLLLFPSCCVFTAPHRRNLPPSKVCSSNFRRVSIYPLRWETGLVLGTSVNRQHSTQRSISSLQISSGRSQPQRVPLILLFVISSLIFPPVSETERVQSPSPGHRTPSPASCRLWCRYRGRDRTRCSAPHPPHSGLAFRSFQRSRC